MTVFYTPSDPTTDSSFDSPSRINIVVNIKSFIYCHNQRHTLPSIAPRESMFSSTDIYIMLTKTSIREGLLKEESVVGFNGSMFKEKSEHI